jgi:hypothetical protein
MLEWPTYFAWLDILHSFLYAFQYTMSPLKRLFPLILVDSEDALVGLLLGMRWAAFGLLWDRDGLPFTRNGLLLERDGLPRWLYMMLFVDRLRSNQDKYGSRCITALLLSSCYALLYSEPCYTLLLSGLARHF